MERASGSSEELEQIDLYSFKTHLISNIYSIGWGIGGWIHCVSEGLDRCVTYCHIAIIYEGQQRYDQRYGRINRIPKGYSQGLGEGFIMADFIDVFQSCLCVCACVCMLRAEKGEHISRDRQIGKIHNKYHSMWTANPFSYQLVTYQHFCMHPSHPTWMLASQCQKPFP